MDMMRPVARSRSPPLKADRLTWVITGSGNNRRFTFTLERQLDQRDVVRRPAKGRSRSVGQPAQPGALAARPAEHPRDTLLHGRDVPLELKHLAYRVVAQNTIGYGGQYPSMTAQSISPEVAVLRAPTGLTAGIIGGPVRVNLTWTDNAANETGFVIERSLDGVSFTQLATAPARSNTGSTSFTDLTVALGTTYTYRVAAVNSVVAGKSGWSNIAMANVSIPSAPSSVSAVVGPSQGGNRSIVLSWTDNSTNESGFVVQRARDAAFTTGVASTNVAANATGATIGGLSRNTNYWFRVWSTNALGPSAQVDATPSPILTLP